MSVFVLKVNADYCPQGIGIPEAPDAWERGQFLTVGPRSVMGSTETPRAPELGDRVHIWVNERGGGAGYVGYGSVVAELGQFRKGVNATYDFRLDQIQLLPEGIPGDAFWPHENEDAISSLRRYTLRQLLWLSDGQAKGFEGALQDIIVSRFGEDERNFLGEPDDPEISAALRECEPQIATAFRELCDASATEQTRLRSELSEVYGGCCCITGSSVSALLDAAFIVPPSSNFRFSNDVRNGLLLRSDIRRLFEAHLLGIDPANRTVLLASELAGTEYEEVKGKRLQIWADKSLLERRFAEFRLRKS